MARTPGHAKRNEHGLLPREEAFVDAYMTCRSPAEACRESGYSVGGAGGIMAREHIKTEIARRFDVIREQVEVSTTVTVEKVVERLWEEANREDERSTHGARVTALGLLAKHLGMFTERHEVVHKLEVPAERRGEIMDFLGRRREDALAPVSTVNGRAIVSNGAH